MQYLQGTRELTLTIESSYHHSWCVDSSSAVHPDMGSHSGIFMTLGNGATSSASNKKKLNTESYTKSELVAIDDSMAQVIWIRHFLEVQGQFILNTTIYQDNKSNILLAKHPVAEEHNICI